MPNHQQMIDLIVENAAKLREAGVLSLSIDGASATFAPSAPAPQPVAQGFTPDAPAVEYSDPLMDPDTYPGGKVPTFTRGDADEDA